MKKLIQKIFPVADIILMPLAYPAAWLLKNIRRAGVHRLPLCKRALMNVGVFPIRNHYYEPQFDNRSPKPDFSKDRNLPGINWNISGQLETIKRFTFSQELADIPQERPESTKLVTFKSCGIMIFEPLQSGY